MSVAGDVHDEQSAAASPTADGALLERPSRGAAATLPYAEGGSDAVASPALDSVREGAPRVPGLDRYEELGVLGQGGMGVVHRVRDRKLGRTLALKIMLPGMLARPGLVARFLEEAQATAQLQHPNIVPVYDLGELPDGRLWFTMKEVSGHTLAAVLERLRAPAVSLQGDELQGWSFRRVISALMQVCEAMDYAHQSGVVHRDLKPANVMVGRHGEVLVMDWGIAKIIGHGSPASGPRVEWTRDSAVQTARSSDDAHRTRMGAIAGTPTYMSPEQAHGQISKVTPQSDIYALGAMLYELLAGRPPYTGADAMLVLEEVRAGPPPPLRSASEHSGSPPRLGGARPPVASANGALSPLLVEACERAMARDPSERFACAGDLGEVLRAWLEGSQRRQDALDVLTGGQRLEPQAESMRLRAASLRSEAQALLAPVDRWAPEERKLPGWEKEDAALALERQAEAFEIEAELAVHGALAHAPELPEAHAALADRYRVEHAALEAEHGDSARVEARLRHHLSWMPGDHPALPAHEAYLQGDGLLTLHTDPAGAVVDLFRYESHRRRLTPRSVRTLGETPLRGVALPMGSYLCVLRHPDCETVRYPVSIGRNEHWDGVPPGAMQTHEVSLPRAGAFASDERYVPGGWAWVGGDPGAQESLERQRVWVDAFVARCFPVTNREYLEFLNDLVVRGRTEDALVFAPRERGGSGDVDGPMIVGFEAGRFVLRPDSDGDLWDDDYPVTMVTWMGATAFAAWLAERTGQPWRLPSELMWEKAARGVDGRRFPWGNHFDPSWACTKDSHPERYLPAVVGRFPVDEGPFGLRGMAGNSADWCADIFRSLGPQPGSARRGGVVTEAEATGYRVVRGAGWFSAKESARLANRRYLDPTYRGFDLGFRVVRWLADPASG